MDSEIQLVSDGDGLAVLGSPTAVEQFLTSEGLASKDLGLRRLGPAFRPALGAASGVVQAGAMAAGASGRWVKLTKESAQLIDKYGLRTSAKTGLATGVYKGQRGRIKGVVEFAKTPGTRLTDPELLTGAAGLMTQLAMQQAMEEITRYLAAIDEKVDDVLRAQKDAVLADVIGVDLLIEEAMTVREHVGRVSKVTWSKVQATAMAIARTQAYALRQLDALAEKVELKAKLGDLAKATAEVESRVPEWLAVLAHCIRLQDALAVLELDRVLDQSPEELDRHRLGVRAARQSRLGSISRCVEQLMDRMHAAAGRANRKVLLHPTMAPAVVQSSNHVVTSAVGLQERLGIESDSRSLEARRWTEAAVEVRDKALEAGAGGVDTAKRVGNETIGRARSMTDKLSTSLAERALRRRPTEGDAAPAEES